MLCAIASTSPGAAMPATAGQFGEAILNKMFPLSDTSPRLKAWTKADIEKFCKENPQAGADLKKLRTGGVITGLGLVGGLGGGAAFWASRPGTLNGKLMSMLIGGLSCGVLGFLSSTSVASLSLGLYKIEGTKVNQQYLDWWAKNGGL
mmetsp:Transcript_34540/g.69097  ORF Transcript_34540/g.69097 Transcript_34540/m.69097 type:complete len:148 (+) Transcript_34540:6-449(+)